MRDTVIDALAALEPALQTLAHRRQVVVDELRAARQESGRTPSELAMLSMARVDTLIGQRLRTLGLGPVLDMHADQAVGPEFLDVFIANVEKLIPAAIDEPKPAA